MIEVNYSLMDDKCFCNYLDFLTGKFYKILPISEVHPHTLYDYMTSLQIELIGNANLINKIKYDAQFLSLIGTLQYLIQNDCSHKVIKREIMKCISIVEKLQKKYGGGVDGH